ncbi:MAG: MarR family transcriptional regulator, partial [Halapricum sp.]
MSKIDDRLLEYLEHDGPAPPAIMEKSDTLPFSRNYINKRLLLLKEIQLVQEIGNGVYQITEKGREYLSGDADL